MDTIMFGKWKLFGLRLSSVAIFAVLMAGVLTAITQNSISTSRHMEGPELSFGVDMDTTFTIMAPSRAILLLRGGDPKDVQRINFRDGTHVDVSNEPDRQVITDPWMAKPTIYYVQSFVLPEGTFPFRGDDRKIVYRLTGDAQNSVDITQRFPLRMRISLYFFELVWIAGALWLVYKEHKRLSQTTI